MSTDELDSSSTLYQYKVFSKIYFGEILSYIEISELGYNACQLIGLYVSYRILSKFFDFITVSFVLF